MKRYRLVKTITESVVTVVLAFSRRLSTSSEITGCLAVGVVQLKE